MNRERVAHELAEALNEKCNCVSVPLPALRGALQSRLGATGVRADLSSSHPHLFSQAPVFIAAAQARRMAEVIRAVEAVVALPAYREAALAWAPEIARYESGARGAFLGFDFHLSGDGPRLIEVNTNAGGGLLAAMPAEMELACCGTQGLQPNAVSTFERRVLDMLMAEWSGAGRKGRPRAIAIVDESPDRQYLYPEFLLAQDAIRRGGIGAAIAAPHELELRAGELRAAGRAVDLVYNRLTDFALEVPGSRALRDAYLAGAAVVTPNPRAHALYADKRLLSLLCSAEWLRTAGLDAHAAANLAGAVPRTELVEAGDAERLWKERRNLFFKPYAGFGSRGAYRGDKLTRRVFEEILAGGYVAQALVPPAERTLSEATAPLKFDIRNFAYAGAVQLLAARLWRGQTTNFRSEGGGFAPVLVLP